MEKSTMKLYPIEDCIAQVEKLRHGKLPEYVRETLGSRPIKVVVYQQFICAHCGVKQTMDKPDAFHASGICEECDAVTDIRKNGCNYMVHFEAV